MKKENSIFILRKRLLSIMMIVTFIFCLLFARTAYLQLFASNKLATKALDQWTRDLPLQAERGVIYDRNGKALAENITTYNLYIRPRMVEDKALTASVVSEVLGVDSQEVLIRLNSDSTSEFTLKKGVDEDSMKELMSRNISGVYYSISTARYYPYGESLSQVLGYSSIDGEGQSGLELYYDNYLKGIDGQMLTQTDLLGREIEDSSKYIINSSQGLDLYLTIDIDIQRIAENVLQSAMLSHEPKRASAIVLDVNSGGVVAMASLPTLDLNNLPRDDIDTLYELQRNAMLSDIYEPGSTFKVLTASANLEEYYSGNNNAFSPEHIFSSASYRTVDGQVIKCWDKHLNGKHSNLNLSGALDNSCNPIFIDIALSLGKDKMYDYLEAFGYGKSLGVDFLGEAQGMLVPINTLQNCDLARIGFGQTVAVTPIQLISATNASINGGYLYQPTFLESVKTQDGQLVVDNQKVIISNPISEKTSQIMREYLYNVVQNGSGKHAKIEGVQVGGKTGTAQKYEDGHIASGKYISSFVGFYPANEPKYICLVLVDEPTGEYYGSTVSAPLAKMIFEGIINLEN